MKGGAFTVKCGKCDTVLRSASAIDWRRCKCSAIWIFGGADRSQVGIDKKSGGSFEDVKTLDGEPFFHRCKDVFCPKWLWPQWTPKYCPDHLAWLEAKSKRQKA